MNKNVKRFNNKNILRLLISILLMIVAVSNHYAQTGINYVEGSSFSVEIELEWLDPVEYSEANEQTFKQIAFKDAVISPLNYLPIYSGVVEINGTYNAVENKLKNPFFRNVSVVEKELLKPYAFAGRVELTTDIKQSRGKTYMYYSFVPIINAGTDIELLTSIELEFEFRQNNEQRGSRDANSWKEQSVLVSGDWYKIATSVDGIYRVDYNFLQNLGIDMSGLSSDAIRLFGTPAGALSIKNSDEKPDDLQELSIEMIDDGDGMFNPGDYFLFYGEDQHTWSIAGSRFVHAKNPYADSNAYFITVNSSVAGSPKRITETNVSETSNYTSNSCDFHAFHESNASNLIKSGREWYGEQMGIVPSFDFGFSVPDIVTTENAFVVASYAARSVSIAGTKVSMSLPNQGVEPEWNIVPAVPSGYAVQYARSGNFEKEFLPTGSNFLTKIEFDNSVNPQASAWVDEIEVNARRRSVFSGGFMGFRDRNSVADGRITRFEIGALDDGFEVWDITDFGNSIKLQVNGNVLSGFWFNQSTDTLREFVVFDHTSFLTPAAVGRVGNQNLHSLRNVDYVIVTHPLFKSHADQLAELHRQSDDFNVEVIEVAKVYNEFSGGVQDVTAIKELMRMLYKRAVAENGVLPSYLLLFGDASYDYMNRISGNSNFVPSYQTRNSLAPTASIVSDDYFGLLDDNEGEAMNDLVDIGIGRLPARNRSEATAMVNKTLAYASSKSFGNWRNWVAFVADDAEENGNPHVFMEDADDLAKIIQDSASRIDVQKIFMDAFTQEAGSGGQRYPDGAAAISERVQKGALMMYYIGHGGELGWAHERILDVATINKWTNSPRLPVFITATCEFTRFDDPRRTSAGEYVMLNPDGGGVALLTTTRAVYGSPNLTLTTQFTKGAFSSITNGQQRLGDLTRLTKVRSLTVGDTASATSLIANNTRCFALLGDPALKLAYPQYEVLITEMPDTIKALDKVKIQGRVADKNGQTLEDFNGIVIPVVFDKESKLQTQDNDGRGAYDYTERRSTLFRGRVRAVNGLFEVEFIVPKDIDKEYGYGKVSSYAYDDIRDASGSYFDFVIGGFSDNPVVDKEGPQVDLFMNNTQFIFGGLTDESPDLYAELNDFSGINMVGTGIGHDLIAVLDGNSSNTLVMNDYYEADENSYQSGKVRYPFNDLEEGLHNLKFQAWDVHNNPSEAYTEFVVANSEEFALDHILNYPNPFTTNTSFYFEHNKPGQSLTVSIDVFTVSGKLVKTFRGDFYSDGYRVGPIQWDGLDEYGDKIARGVYLYKLKVNTPQGQTAEEFERLVILN